MANFDEAFDWVVIGSGAGSMSSALLMKKAGKSVVVLEKGKWFGGTTCKSGGVMWIPGNRFMDPGEDSQEMAMAYLNAVVPDGPESPGTSPERRRAYAVEAPRMLDFIVGEGVALERGSKFWPDYYDELPGGCKTSRTVTALPFNKKELPGGWNAKLRPGFLEMPVRLDDAMKIPFKKYSKDINRMFLRTAFKFVFGKLTGKQWVTAGAALQGRMLKAVLERDAADIRLESPGRELVVEDGKVTGVVTEKDGKPWRIGARLGVLVNAGGFSQNQAMRDRYEQRGRKEWSNGIETDDGDMHTEMERIGGVLAQMDQMVGYQMTRAPGYAEAYVKPGTQNTTARPHAILIDQSGVRYLNEGGSYELFCETMIERNRTVPAVPSWGIIDSQFLAKYPLAGVSKKKLLDQWIAAGHLKRADTLEELAGQISVEPETLRATVERWNSFVDKGVDEDFGRGERAYDHFLGDPFNTAGPNPSMGRIEQAPFYAFDTVPGDVGTYGGVVTDTNARVLRGDGSPIPGLYACGVSTASPMGGVYPGAGASIGPSMTFGWVAAKHAAGLDNQVG